MAIARDPSLIRPGYHYGVPVLRLHVGDPLPHPRVPERYAVEVNPDLARYLFTFNHPDNRNLNEPSIKKYARDMIAGDWEFTNEAVTFDVGGVLQEGQNRLMAVTEAGIPVWMMLDFGWPEGLIQVIGRGRARTNADALTIESIPSAAATAGAMNFVAHYQNTVGKPLKWNNATLTASEAAKFYHENAAEWSKSVTAGKRAYDSVAGLGPSIWIAAHFVISAVRPEAADAFFGEFAGATGEVGSATRRLRDRYLRRSLKDTASGDRREPMENIIRVFNAWSKQKTVQFIRKAGSFDLSPVRKA